MVALIPRMSFSEQNGIKIKATGFDTSKSVEFNKNAFDGSTSTYWKLYGAYPNVVVTFPRPVILDSAWVNMASHSGFAIAAGQTEVDLKEIYSSSSGNLDQRPVISDKTPYKIVALWRVSTSGTTNNWYCDIYEFQLYGEYKAEAVAIEYKGKLYDVVNKNVIHIGDVDAITVDKYPKNLTIDTIPTTLVTYNGVNITLLEYLQKEMPNFKIHMIQK